MPQKIIDWNEKNIRYLRNHYRYGNIEKVAEHFGVSKMYIMKAACKLKISSGRYLTKRQREYLDNHSEMSNQQFAEKFGYSSKAVRKMRYNYNVGTILECNTEMFTCTEIGKLVGKHKSTIAKCWVKDGLKYQYVGKRYKMISRNDLFEFMQANPDRWKASECEYYFFKGNEWFEEKKKAEALKVRQERWGEWYEVN